MKQTESIPELFARGAFVCPACGRVHDAKVHDVWIGHGAIGRIPAMLDKYGCRRAFVLADENTYAAAGDAVTAAIRASGRPYSLYVMGGGRTEPDEHAVGSVLLHYDAACDLLVAVGSGVINDIGKILAAAARIPSIVVGTAPSMDGYASGTSSVIRDNLKVSVNSHCPDVVIGDLDVLCRAPARMIAAGIGDMIAKYISIAEWRIGHLVTGEYYCPAVANLVNASLGKVMSHIDGVPRRDPDAIAAVMEGMVLSGIAANYAGVSRPASGMEHYFSHVWDMRNVAFGTPADLHGIQCGIGTVDALRVWEAIRKLHPDREKAAAAVRAFDYEAWKAVLRRHLGKSADAMIENEEKEHKFDPAACEARCAAILDHWEDIGAVIDALPPSDAVASALAAIGAPTKATEIGLSPAEERAAFLMTKDVRDKYIGSRLLFDIGELDAVADALFPA